MRWSVYEAGKTRARAPAPDQACYAQVKDRIDGKRAALSEARKIIRKACHQLAELGDDAFTAENGQPGSYHGAGKRMERALTPGQALSDTAKTGSLRRLAGTGKAHGLPQLRWQRLESIAEEHGRHARGSCRHRGGARTPPQNTP